MDAFDERERLFEARYAYGDNLLFRIRSRRDRLAALWAAGLMGLEAEAVRIYTEAMINGGHTGPGGLNLHARLAADLRAHGVGLSNHRLGKQLARLLEEARRQIMDGTNGVPR